MKKITEAKISTAGGISKMQQFTWLLFWLETHHHEARSLVHHINNADDDFWSPGLILSIHVPGGDNAVDFVVSSWVVVVQVTNQGHPPGCVVYFKLVAGAREVVSVREPLREVSGVFGDKGRKCQELSVFF